MSKITTATDAQWAEIDRIHQQWIDRQTDRISLDDAKAAVAKMWETMGYGPPEVLQAPSPLATVRLMSERTSTPIAQVERYWSIWWGTWAGWYEGAEVLGVEFGPEREVFSAWCRSCPFVAPSEKLVVVSDNPVEIYWQDGQLHREDGPAILYADGYSLWSIDGVRVNEKIVMRPDELTVDEIHDIANEEVRRIATDRYGWNRYLDETSSTVLDCGRNDIEATYEILADTPVGQRLITYCPSTGRRYALGIPGDRVNTCEEAQQRLWGDRDVIFIGRT